MNVVEWLNVVCRWLIAFINLYLLCELSETLLKATTKRFHIYMSECLCLCAQRQCIYANWRQLVHSLVVICAHQSQQQQQKKNLNPNKHFICSWNQPFLLLMSFIMVIEQLNLRKALTLLLNSRYEPIVY